MINRFINDTFKCILLGGFQAFANSIKYNNGVVQRITKHSQNSSDKHYIKLNSKKDTIEKTAEIDILALDIKAGLYGDTVDSAQLGALIDKKYKIKAEKAKATVGAYAALKGVLTEAQKEKMKELYKKCKPSR